MTSRSRIGSQTRSTGASRWADKNCNRPDIAGTLGQQSTPLLATFAPFCVGVFSTLIAPARTDLAFIRMEEPTMLSAFPGFRLLALILGASVAQVRRSRQHR